MDSLKTRLQAFVERIQDALEDLSPRDRRLLVGLVAGLLVLGLGAAIWAMSSSLSAQQSRVAERANTLRIIQEMSAEHAAAAASVEELEAKIAEYEGTDLQAFLDQASHRVGVSDRLDSVRDKPNATEVNGNLEERRYTAALSSLTLEEYTNFLWELESTGYPLRIRSSTVRTRTRLGEKTLSVDLDISAWRIVPETDGEG